MGTATLPCGPGNYIHQVGGVGSGRVQWPLLGEAAGLGSRQRLASVSGWGGGAFSWLQGLGTKLKLGSDGHQPDHGAGKISPLSHFLSTHRSDPGEREKVGAKAPRPPRGFLLTNVPKRKVMGPLVVSRVAVFISILSWICFWVPEGPFPNPFGFSIFGGLSLIVLCFPTLGVPPPPLCVQSYILPAGSPDFIFACGRGLLL